MNADTTDRIHDRKTVKATRTSRQIVKYFLADLRALKSRKAEEAVADRIRILKHEAVAKCGSYEVRFSDSRPRKYFFWEDIPSRSQPSKRPRLFCGPKEIAPSAQVSRSRTAIGVAANQASKVVRVAGIAEGWRHVFVVTRRRCPFVAPTWSEVETRGRVGGEVMPRPGVMHGCGISRGAQGDR